MKRVGTRGPLVALSIAALATALVGCTNGDEEPADDQEAVAEGRQDNGGEADPAEDEDDVDAQDDAEDDTDYNTDDDADEPEEADEADNGGTFDMAACDLLTAEDLSATLGVDFEAGEVPSDDELRYDDECVFEVSSGDAPPATAFQLNLTEAAGLTNLDAEWQGYRDSVNVLEDLDGIGDDAFIAQTAVGMELVIRTDAGWVGAFATSGIESWEDNITEIAELLEANL